MPCLLTAPRMPTSIRRLDRSSDWSFCTTGRTKTEAPSTTFWPELSVDRPPSAVWVVRPLRPVTMNASFGPATLIRESTKSTRMSTRRTAPPMAMSRAI